jgi:hypothetical protein
VGNIQTWRQQADTTAVRYDYRYDLDGPTPVILQPYAYAYRAAGIRTAEQIDDVVTGATRDGLTACQPIARRLLTFAGTVSEPVNTRECDPMCRCRRKR